LIAQYPDWHRTALSRHLCALWNWRNPVGQLKDMAARALLLKLAQRGWITLPACRWASPNRMRHKPRPTLAVPAPAVPITEALTSRNHEIHEIKLSREHPVRTTKNIE
jgi:hypothetical protein